MLTSDSIGVEDWVEIKTVFKNSIRHAGPGACKKADSTVEMLLNQIDQLLDETLRDTNTVNMALERMTRDKIALEVGDY
eukprot:760452-Hanusia_phi.AAC.5